MSQLFCSMCVVSWRCVDPQSSSSNSLVKVVHRGLGVERARKSQTKMKLRRVQTELSLGSARQRC
ncbi:hypothetical protein B0T26DRAFT_732193 [Lasiosphaeria miniovina]|uniref:Uncharacterized protein n=1 Tax=Lasiosphaeria miniovina TaxID=1954250 RepID=A0AA39ZUC0_9PEZI|nr:uncharacterized protein B0T26DRAFT_732193 [Lasiosphaeria miniovina]KAK0703660.1 hypothetical protein B0T26DRAFT_732193 [Lasiosphaeria miniovina]